MSASVNRRDDAFTYCAACTVRLRLLKTAVHRAPRAALTPLCAGVDEGVDEGADVYAYAE